MRGIESKLALAGSGDLEAEDARKLEAELIGRWVQAVNTFVGLAKALGMERRMRAPDLQSYIASSGNGSADEEGER